jgi:uncharacterized protein YndB with AHSA1/START domain
MHGPNGASYPNEKIFVEVVEPERVVFQHRQAVHSFQMTIEFAPHAGGTEVTWRMVFESAAEYARVKSHIVKANEENFDRLEAHLARIASTTS